MEWLLYVRLTMREKCVVRADTPVHFEAFSVPRMWPATLEFLRFLSRAPASHRSPSFQPSMHASPGGGGCALTILLGENLSKASLIENMAAEGFKCYESSLGGDGVLWHGGTVPPEFLAPAAAERDGSGIEAGVEESGGFAARLAHTDKKRLRIAAAAVLAVVAVVPVVVAGLRRRGSRW